MEKLLEVVLQRSSSQQQFVLQGVVVQHPEKLQQGETKMFITGSGVRIHRQLHMISIQTHSQQIYYSCFK